MSLVSMKPIGYARKQDLLQYKPAVVMYDKPIAPENGHEAVKLYSEDQVERMLATDMAVRLSDGYPLARAFHETYERLAPKFGYVTRGDTREFDPTTSNGRLMTAVCAEMLSLIRRADAIASATKRPEAA